MRRPARSLAFVFAACVGLYLIAGAALQAFLPRCVANQGTLLTSPAGSYVATIDQRICEDKSRSWTRVLIAAPGKGEKFVAAEVPNAETITLNWKSDTQLQVTYPNAPIRDLPGETWPAISIRPQIADGS